MTRLPMLVEDDVPESPLYMHTVMCQTSLPYRDPSVREWERTNGRVSIKIYAGEAWDSDQGRWVAAGLPFGPKPRLLLAHINREALIQQSPIVDVERSLTAFVRGVGLHTSGRNIRVVRDQLIRLSAASMTLGFGLPDGRSVTVKTTGVVEAFELWSQPDDSTQRALWPSTVRLSPEYYRSLIDHAVPLADRALAALAHSAMGLDVYAWLAQRLHRINQPSFVSWVRLQEQFGAGYERIDNFRVVFRRTLSQVQAEYQAADITVDKHGMTLRHSPPPVAPRSVNGPVGDPITGCG